MILRCTRKLLAVIGPGRVTQPAPDPGPEDWYANLLWFDRRKCLLLTQAATLFTIFESSVTASSLRITGHLATRLIDRELRHEGLPSRHLRRPQARRTNPYQDCRPAACWGA